MSNDCGCQKTATEQAKTAGGGAAPTLTPPQATSTQAAETGEAAVPTLVPGAQSGGGASLASAGAIPMQAPPITSVQGQQQTAGAVGAWLNNKLAGALWSIAQSRNSWVFVTGVGWKKLANNSDSAIVALTQLCSHARLTQSSFNYREESDGMIHELYVW